MIQISASGITTIESHDRVAIQTTVKTIPIPTVFRVNIAAKIMGISDNKENP